MLFILPRPDKKAWSARPTRSGPVRQDIILCDSDKFLRVWARIAVSGPGPPI
jgi:hypothetical protein